MRTRQMFLSLLEDIQVLSKLAQEVVPIDYKGRPRKPETINYLKNRAEEKGRRNGIN